MRSYGAAMDRDELTHVSFVTPLLLAMQSAGLAFALEGPYCTMPHSRVLHAALHSKHPSAGSRSCLQGRRRISHYVRRAHIRSLSMAIVVIAVTLPFGTSACVIC